MRFSQSMDTHTLTTLNKRKHPPHFFAPLGNAPYFRSIGIPKERMHILDWWDARRVEVEVEAGSGQTGAGKLTFDVTCTPAQHFTGRGVLDRFKTLWASWVVEEVRTPAPLETQAGQSKLDDGLKVFFAGDTGYRAVRDGQDENTVPVCPAFKEIGERFGGFDFAMIPIG